MLKSLLGFDLQEELVAKNNLSDYRLPQSIKEKLDELLESYGYRVDSYTSYAVTDKEREGRAANFAIIPNQYFSYASKMYDFALTLFEYFKLFDQLRDYSHKLVGSFSEIQSAIESDKAMAAFFESSDDIVLFSKFIDKSDDSFRLGSKRLINDQGVPRGSKDCFGSVVLKQINMPDASASIFGRLVYDLCVNMGVYKELKEYDESLSLEVNTGLGGVVYSEQVLRKFIRGVVKFLFEKNHQEVLFSSLIYETDGSGVQYSALKESGVEVYRLFRVSESIVSSDKLSSGGVLRYFEKGFLYSGKYFYLTNQWADTDSVQSRSREFSAFAKCFNALYKNYCIEKNNNQYELRISGKANFNCSTLSKPFLLLAGISGTGKTRFVREQAEAAGSIDKNYKLIPVRPDWHEPSDLLGYISRLTEEKYIVTAALQFIVSAWIDACDLGRTSKTNLANKPPAEMTTFWLCLDEMNLAPVEQYFADYLSVMETRKWDGDRYTCDPILRADIINLLGEAAKNSLRSELGMAAEEHDPLWAYFSEVGIPLPPNLIIAGTVNMDETTHGFSRKVIDRALTLDFGQFFPNDFDAFFKPTSAPVIFSFPAISHAKQSDFNDVPADPDGQKSLDFLKGINQILKGSMFELAYRALNELFVSVVCIKPKDEIELQAVWDDFLMTKVLPRIEGDDDKLKNHNLASDKNIIENLDEHIKIVLGNIYETGYRPDFLRKNIENNEPIPILCRSKKKLRWMIARLKNNGFTTFWP